MKENKKTCYKVFQKWYMSIDNMQLCVIIWVIAVSLKKNCSNLVDIDPVIDITGI